MNDPFASEPLDGMQMGGEAAGSGNILSLLPVIARQRKWYIIIPALLGLMAGVVAAVLLEPQYRANATMIVESPQLPDEILALDGTEMVGRRIARIRQQVTARPDLINLIERYGLYSDQRNSQSLSAAVDTMREAIAIVPNEVDGGNNTDTTIAFELSYTYSGPVEAQAVTQDLMDRILALDASGNIEQATNTVQFLQDQADELQMQVASLQNMISSVTAANGAVLGSGGAIVSTGTGSYDMQIANLQRDNQQLTAQRSMVANSDDRDPIVVAAEQGLAGARAVYADNHPDVVLARQRLAQAKELAKSNVSKLPVNSINQQIAFNNAQIAQLRAAKSAEDSRLQSRLSTQARAPLVQQRITDLQQQLMSVNQQYEQVRARLMSAQAGVRAEDEQMGERLTVVEPPVVPDQTSWPNRPLLVIAGIIGGIGLGIVLALAVEFLFQPIRDPVALRSIRGASPLGVVPVIERKKRPNQNGMMGRIKGLFSRSGKRENKTAKA
ncbi:MAG: lipopolysaccharide biosynthesis protein [Pontixanthobacter sp.]